MCCCVSKGGSDRDRERSRGDDLIGGGEKGMNRRRIHGGQKERGREGFGLLVKCSEGLFLAALLFSFFFHRVFLTFFWAGSFLVLWA